MSESIQINEKIEHTKEEIRQLENRQKVLLQKKKLEERKPRTRRLIERGAILEKVFPSVLPLSNDELIALLSDISRFPEVGKLLETHPNPLV